MAAHATKGSSGLPDNSDWMSVLPEKVHSLPLNSIAIPGSHDSFAAYLDKAGPIGPDASTAIKELVKVFGTGAKEILYKWSITQSLTITEQLKAGIRSFDLRVATKPETEDLYFVHDLYSSKIEDVMNELKEFLDAHPKEIVLLDFNHFYDVTEFHHKQFLSMLLEILGYKMCPYLDTESVTLEMLWENNLQVLAFYHNDIVKDYGQFWPGKEIPAPWAKTTDLNILMTFLKRKIEAGRPMNTFYVSQGVLSPDAAFILSHLGSDRKQALSGQVVAPLVSWIKEQHIGGAHGVNVFIMDFVDMGQYIPTIINLNHSYSE